MSPDDPLERILAKHRWAMLGTELQNLAALSITVFSRTPITAYISEPPITVGFGEHVYNYFYKNDQFWHM